MSVLLLGDTDLTLAVADEMVEAGLRVAAVVDVGASFTISYSTAAVTSARHASMQEWAEQHAVPRYEYESNDQLVEIVRRHTPDVGLAAGWYHMVARRVRDALPLGCLGLHASLLPALRGGAPLNWAILLQLPETGVSLFSLADGVDDGPLYGQEAVPITARTTIGDLVSASRNAACRLVRERLPSILDGRLEPWEQQGEPTYALQRQPEDGRIDWALPAEEIDRLVRAVSRPYPGARTVLDGEEVYIWRARPALRPAVAGAPGQLANLVEHEVPVVVTGSGLLLIDEATEGDGANALGRLRSASQRRFSAA